MSLDRDLQSIQEVRDLMKKAKAAQKILGRYDQSQVDQLVKAVADACTAYAEPLAKQAAEETGFGIWQDKVIKNLLGSRMVYEHIRDMKTIGMICQDDERKVWEVAVPVGIVAALIPSTNPTSTVMFKALISLKAGNAVVVSPHPNASGCIGKTVELIREAIRSAGGPEDLVQCIMTPTIQATNELMKHPDTGIILATGGEAMVKAAYSSGNPALGVGPGNGPAFIERSADIPKAVSHIMDSKTFDNGTICASEQSIIVENCISGAVIQEVKRQGGYFLTEGESTILEKLIMRSNNTMNPAIVGKSAVTIADMAGIPVPAGTRVLVSKQTEVGKKHPYSREKLCPILAFYEEEDWKSACEKAIAILNNEGAGHTMTIHSQNMEVIRQFALEKPISRLLVNTAAALGGVGATTNLAPALTLGCGAVGGSATSDNVGPMNLLNIRRVAFGVTELAQLRRDQPSQQELVPGGHQGRSAKTLPGSERGVSCCGDAEAGSVSQKQIAEITKLVMEQLLKL